MTPVGFVIVYISQDHAILKLSSKNGYRFHQVIFFQARIDTTTPDPLAFSHAALNHFADPRKDNLFSNQTVICDPFRFLISSSNNQETFSCPLLKPCSHQLRFHDTLIFQQKNSCSPICDLTHSLQLFHKTPKIRAPIFLTQTDTTKKRAIICDFTLLLYRYFQLNI